jgi:hypothetical protein
VPALSEPLLSPDKDGGDVLIEQDVAAPSDAAERRGLVVSFVTLLLSIPALVGA